MSITADFPRPFETATVSGELEARTLSPDEFAALYEEHRPALYRYVVARTGDRDRAEDLVQEVFAKAFARRDRFDAGRPFWPWLVSIAARECIDAHRRRRYAASRIGLLAQTTWTEPFDATSTAVLRALEDPQLAREFDRLPVRQRVAMQLVALDGWSYAEVAEHLGYSVGMVKALLVRARRKLRNVGVGSLGALGGGLRSLRRRWQRALARLQPALGTVPGTGEVMGVFSMGAGPHVAVVAVVVALGLLATPDPSSSVRYQEVALASSTGMSTGTTTVPDRTEVSAPASPPVGVTLAGTAERTANELAVAALPADDNDNPESMLVSRFYASPRYEDDHTVFLVREVPLDVPVLNAPLLVSRDGGASWQRLRALGLAPVVQLLFPPAYPRDGRLYALTTKGLQLSSNGGDTFETVFALPIPTTMVAAPTLRSMTAAVSPRFDADDPTILVAARHQLWEYRADTGAVDVVRPGAELASHEVRSVAFATDDPSGRSVLLSTFVPGFNNAVSGFYSSRCSTTRPVVPPGARGLDCRPERTAIPSSSGLLPFRQPAGSNVVFLGFEHPLVSLDGGRTFTAARARWGEARYQPHDIQAVPSAGGQSAIMAQFGERPDGEPGFGGPQLARTDDAGRTWRELTIDLPNFLAARTAIVTPSGRILAASMSGGIACSEDNGRTWARLCPTPDTA